MTRTKTSILKKDVLESKSKIREHASGYVLATKRTAKWEARRKKSAAKVAKLEAQYEKAIGPVKKERVSKELEPAREENQRNTRKVIFWRKRRSTAYRAVHKWKDSLKARVARLKKAMQKQSGTFTPSMLNGHPGNISNHVKTVIAQGYEFGLYTSSTTDGSSHASTSYHYPRNNSSGLGEGVDMAGGWNAMVRYQNFLMKDTSKFNELFGPDNAACIKDGTRMSLSEGSLLENAHDNHVHLAPR